MGKKSKKLIEESAYINICGFTKYKIIPGFGQAISSGITAMYMTNDKKKISKMDWMIQKLDKTGNL